LEKNERNLHAEEIESRVGMGAETATIGDGWICGTFSLQTGVVAASLTRSRPEVLIQFRRRIFHGPKPPSRLIALPFSNSSIPLCDVRFAPFAVSTESQMDSNPRLLP
jgi:hypothetical protein